jgi:hypothetical protein
VLINWLVQFAFAPVTVILVVEEGFTVKVEPVRFPGFQVKLDAPLAVKVAVWPEQTVGEVAVSVGVLLTNTAVVTLLLHVPFAPVTV